MATRRRHSRVRLCAALTFDGKLCSLPAEAAGWRQRWMELCARSDALLVDAATAPAALEIAGPTLRRVMADGSATTGLPDLIKRLHVDDWIVCQLLCGGGAALFQALLAANLVDELHLVIRPNVGGARSQPTLSGPPGSFFAHSILWRLRRLEICQGECLLKYDRKPET